MSIDNGNYKKFGGTMNYTKIKDIRTDNFYVNNVTSKEINIQQLLWDLTSNTMKNTYPGNIVIGGDISGVISNSGTNGSEVTFRNDTQLWQTFTDVSMIGTITNKNQNYLDISNCNGVTSDMNGAGYIYDGGVEISGVLLVGTGHANRDGGDCNYSFIHGISNEVVGSGKHNYIEGSGNRILAGSEYSHCEGEGNTIIGDFNHCEGSGNMIQGNYCFAAGISNEIAVDTGNNDGNWCFADGYNNTIRNQNGIGSLLCKTEGFSNSIYDSSYSIVRGEGNLIGGGKGNVCQGGYNTISGENYFYNMIEGSGNRIVENINGGGNGAGAYGSQDVMASFVGGISNYVDASFSNVFGTYNTLDSATSKTLFGIGRGTSNSARANALAIYNSDNTVYLNTTCSINDSTVGWFRSNSVYNKFIDGKIEIEGLKTTFSTETSTDSQGNTVTNIIEVTENVYTKIYSNSTAAGSGTNISCDEIVCSGDVYALPHFTNGVKDYNSGFLFGSSSGLEKADKWIVGTMATEKSDTGGTPISVPYQYNIDDATLVDISGAGFRAGAKSTLVIETNEDKWFVSDASVCDVITVRPENATGSGTDVYLPAPYYGIGTMYTVQFPPVPSSYISSGSGTWDTGVNYNRAIFDINGGGFFSGDSQTDVNVGYAIHFIYTAANDGILWKTKLYKN